MLKFRSVFCFDQDFGSSFLLRLPSSPIPSSLNMSGQGANRFAFRPHRPNANGSAENTPRLGGSNGGLEPTSGNNSPRSRSEAGSSHGAAQSVASRPPSSKSSGGSIAAANTPTAKMLRLLNKITSDTASPADMLDFHARFVSGWEAQLPAYRYLRDLCEQGAKYQACRIDMAMHPDISRYSYREMIYQFLVQDRDCKDNNKDYGLGSDREKAAERIRVTLIEKVIAGKATGPEKEVFRLKNEFDCMACISPEQKAIFKQQGFLKVAITNLNKQLLESVKGILHNLRFKNPTMARIVVGVMQMSANAEERVELHYALMADFSLNYHVEHMICFFNQLVDDTPEQIEGKRIATIWTRANRNLIGEAVSPWPKPEVVQQLEQRLNESSSFRALVADEDNEMRTGEAYVGTWHGQQRCANLRYLVETASLYAWVRDEVEGGFPPHRKVTELLEKKRKDAADKKAKEEEKAAEEAAAAAEAAAEAAAAELAAAELGAASQSAKSKKGKKKGKGGQGGGSAQGPAQGGSAQGGEAQSGQAQGGQAHGGQAQGGQSQGGPSRGDQAQGGPSRQGGRGGQPGPKSKTPPESKGVPRDPADQESRNPSGDNEGQGGGSSGGGGGGGGGSGGGQSSQPKKKKGKGQKKG